MKYGIVCIVCLLILVACKPSCDPPYMLKDEGCCLDNNKNDICDLEEAVEPEEAKKDVQNNTKEEPEEQQQEEVPVKEPKTPSQIVEDIAEVLEIDVITSSEGNYELNTTPKIVFRKLSNPLRNESDLRNYIEGFGEVKKSAEEAHKKAEQTVQERTYQGQKSETYYHIEHETGVYNITNAKQGVKENVWEFQFAKLSIFNVESATREGSRAAIEEAIKGGIAVKERTYIISSLFYEERLAFVCAPELIGFVIKNEFDRQLRSTENSDYFFKEDIPVVQDQHKQDREELMPVVEKLLALCKAITE